MRHRTQLERDAFHFDLLEALKNSLENLNNLRMIPPDDARVLDLKKHLGDKIAKLEHDGS